METPCTKLSKELPRLICGKGVCIESHACIRRSGRMLGLSRTSVVEHGPHISDRLTKGFSRMVRETAFENLQTCVGEKVAARPVLLHAETTARKIKPNTFALCVILHRLNLIFGSVYPQVATLTQNKN
jgi:hypothetical protein